MFLTLTIRWLHFHICNPALGLIFASFVGMGLFLPVQESLSQDFSQVEGKLITRISVVSPIRYPKQEVLQAISLQTGDSLSSMKVRDSLVRLYDLGLFQSIQVEARESGKGVEVIYSLSPKIYLKGVFFEGNRTLPAALIREKLDVKEGDEWSSGDIPRFIQLIQSIYEEEGFFQTAIEAIEKIDTHEQNAFLFISIQEGPPAVVSEFKIIGTLGFSKEAVKKQMKVNINERYSYSRIEGDIKKLSDWYVNQNYINVVIDHPIVILDPDRNEVEITLLIDAGSKVQVAFQGNQVFSNQDLLEKVLVFSERSDDHGVLSDSVDRIKDFYRKAGYPFSSASFQREEVQPGEVKVVFKIVEGAFSTLESIQFEGNEKIDTKVLKKLMATKEAGIFSKGIFLEEVFQEDVQIIRQYYRERGFRQVQVKWMLSHPPEKTHLLLSIQIEEGVQNFVHNIHFEGNQNFSNEELVNITQLEKGVPLNPELLLEDLKRLVSFYSQRGYIYAKIDQEINSRDDHKQVDIIYRIREAQQAFIGDIILKGNDYTRDDVILRELLVQKGEVFNLEKILKSTRRLYRLGFFKEIRFEPSPLGVDKTVRDLELRVDERFTGKLDFGGGYGEEEGVVGFFQISQSNLYGTGRNGSLRAEAGFKESAFTLSFIEPWFLNFDINARVGLTYQIQERTSYELTTYGTTVGVEKDFSEAIRGVLSYQFEKNSTDVDSPQLIPEDEDRFNIATINPSLFRNTRNHLFNPTAGSLNGIQFRQAAQIIGSEEQFTKLTLRSIWYFSLTSWSVFAVSGSGGLANEFGETKEVPITERFFLGGRETVRGYKQDSVGPRASDGTLIGGDAMLNFNYEIRFSLPFKLGLVGFLDSGMVWREPREMDLSELNYSAGWGIRYFTPIGPLRVDIGYKLDPEGGEDPYEIHFTLGQIF